MLRKIIAAGLGVAGTILMLWGCSSPTRSSTSTSTTTTTTTTTITDNTGTPVWAQTASSGTSSSVFNAATTDSSGNVYAAGYLFNAGTYGFGNGITATGPAGGYNAVLVKYNASGTAQWAKTVSSGASYSPFNAVATDSSGNVYAAGYVQGTGTYDFGNSVTATGPAANQNLILVKYDASGTPQWARTLSSGGSSDFNSVRTDSSGNVYVAGYITANTACDFGNSVTVTGTGTPLCVVLVKYNASGTAQWAQTMSSPSGNTGGSFTALAIDGSGNIYAAGGFSYSDVPEAVGFGNSVTATGSSASNNVLLVKYNTSGTAQWAQTLSSGDGDTSFSSVATDSSGNIYATGYINDTISYGFGNGVTATGASSGNNNAVLVKYNASGTAQWAQTVAPGSSTSTFGAVTTDSSGNVYAAGSITGTDSYGFGNSVTAAGACAGNPNVVLVKYNGSGTAQWAKTESEATTKSEFNAVTIDSSGKIYAAGDVTGTGTHGFGGSVTAAGANSNYSVLLVKYQ